VAMKKMRVTAGSGNVFRDLGLKNPEERLAKVMLAARIVQILEGRHLNQTTAAKLLGVDQQKVSQIYRGRLDEFSLERLIRSVTELGEGTRTVVRDKSRLRYGDRRIERLDVRPLGHKCRTRHSCIASVGRRKWNPQSLPRESRLPFERSPLM